ncbi:low molecular weight protein-tyrosine-phosphatase [Virgibacillus sp. W0181]|uniref:low molecular weight protein-tyrosine-phosphatase n=1 Tax=Virgibacillus sp. W0181 TaxID=3391581 RepID=UPI003F48F90B
MISVLFVCLGNICRSPMAEAIFRHNVIEAQLQDKIKVDSAGTGDWHAGNPPHHGTREVLERENISYDGMKARQVHKDDWNAFDYIIAMDEQNIDNLKTFFDIKEGPVVKKLMEFVEDPEEINVPDPYFTGDFDYTHKLVSKGCSNLLDYIRKNNSI